MSNPIFINEHTLNISGRIIEPSYYSTHIFPPLNNIIGAIIITLAVYVFIIPYFWMLYYEVVYGEGYGERYIKGLISKEEKQELRKHGFKIKK
jgi:hypothetical protein